MSYAIYKTEALVLRIIPHGEANVDAVFLTRDLGKITARVQSARKSESKMRMQLTRYHRVVIDLVRGKNTWRLVGITEIDPNRFVPTDNGSLARARALRLVESLIQGEEAHPELFDFFCTREARDTAGELEIFYVINVLSHLGYWQDELNITLDYCLANKKELVAKINTSIQATQMVV